MTRYGVIWVVPLVCHIVVCYYKCGFFCKQLNDVAQLYSMFLSVGM